MMDNISWVFSGIGVAVISWIGTLIYRCYFKPKKDEISRNSAKIKGNGNITIQEANHSKIEINQKNENIR